MKSRVRKPEKRWTLVNRQLIFHNQFTKQFPQFEWVEHRVQEPELDQVQEQMKRTQMIVKRNVKADVSTFCQETKKHLNRKVGSEGTPKLGSYWKLQLVAYKVNMELRSE